MKKKWMNENIENEIIKWWKLWIMNKKSGIEKWIEEWKWKKKSIKKVSEK